MISVLQGTVEDRTSDSLVIMTDGGIGFLVSVPASLAASAPANGKRMRLMTHMAVREDAVQLYGFEDAQQKDLFLKLVAISGVGPKAAMSILSTLSVQELLAAVATNDAKSITRAPGVGKKIAERIILELRGKMDSFIAGTQAAVQVSASVAGNAQSEAVQALMSLGYTGAEAMTAIAKVDDGKAKTEELILRALRMLDQA